MQPEQEILQPVLVLFSEDFLEEPRAERSNNHGNSKKTVQQTLETFARKPATGCDVITQEGL